MLPEVRMARVLDAIRSHRAGRLSCVEAGELLGLSERHFRRLRDAYEDRRGGAGRPSARPGEFETGSGRGSEAVGGDVSDAVFRFHGQALPRTGGGPSDGGRPAVPAVLQLGEERVATAGSDDQGSPARGAPAQARAASAAGHDAVSGRLETRMAGPGPRSGSDRDDGRRDQRDHFDFPVRGGGHGLQLSRTVGDDPRAWSVSSFYTDRGSHYFVTPKAGAKVDKTQLTQVGRALKQLHVEPVPSYSPQARGRMERLWDTSQKRCLRC